MARIADAAKPAARSAPAPRPLRVPLPPSFDFAWATGFLAARAVPSMERVDVAVRAATDGARADDAGGYRRCVRVEGRPLVLDIRLDAGAAGSPSPALLVRWASSPRLAPSAVQRVVRRMFDLDAEVDAFAALAARDRLLAPLVGRRPFIRLPQLADPFEGLVRAILGQQVSLAAACTMTDRVARLAGDRAEPLDGDSFLCFPSAAALADVPLAELRRIGLTRAKASCVAGVARAAASGTLDLDALRGAPAEVVDATLTALPGIGPWTAAYLRMRALGDRDAFPVSDLGVVKAMRAAGVEGRAAIERRAERWRPWRAYATLHLWAALA